VAALLVIPAQAGIHCATWRKKKNLSNQRIARIIRRKMKKESNHGARRVHRDKNKKKNFGTTDDAD
jgi:hypothetical protein